MLIGSADPSGPCLDGWTLLAALAAQTPADCVAEYPHLKLLDTVQAPNARWQQKYGRSLWFQFTPTQLAAWYNERNKVKLFSPRKRTAWG